MYTITYEKPKQFPAVILIIGCRTHATLGVRSKKLKEEICKIIEKDILASSQLTYAHIYEFHYKISVMHYSFN